MKHWKIRNVYRDTDGMVVAHGKPFTVPPELGKAMLVENPGQHDLLDKDFEVPDDIRRKVTSTPAMKPEQHGPTTTKSLGIGK